MPSARTEPVQRATVLILQCKKYGVKQLLGELKVNKGPGGMLHNVPPALYTQFSQTFLINIKLTDIFGFNLLK